MSIFCQSGGDDGGWPRSEDDLRAQIIDLCVALSKRGFSVGTAGIVLARLPDGLLIDRRSHIQIRD